jgi:hypothetical protein
VGTRIGTALPPAEAGAAAPRPLRPDTIKEVPTDLPWTRVYIKDAFTGDAARRALRGAAERLAKPSCRVIFAEFQDERGQPLSVCLNMGHVFTPPHTSLMRSARE